MQNFKQKFQQKLFPQQLHLIKLIELSTLDFEDRISQEIEENPLLDIDIKNNYVTYNVYNINKKKQTLDYSTINYDLFFNILNIDIKKKSNNIFIKINHNVYENLKLQLYNCILKNDEFIIANFILGNIDEEGYLRREYHELIDDLSSIIDQRIDNQKIEKLIEIIQNLEPQGIGAKNLKECLLIQLKHKKKSTSIEKALIIIHNYFDLLCKQKYKVIMNYMKLNNKQLYSAINEIKRLNPKPGKIYDEENSFDNIQVIPDFLLRIEKNLFDLFFNKRNIKKLYIVPIYIEMLRRFQENYLSNKKNILFIKKKLEKAKYFINAMKQRKKTLLLTMEAILNFQKEYFYSGEKQKIRPMTLKNIAENLQIKISTVSRVINKKYIETPYGTFLVKDFFSEKIFHTFGEEVSNIEVKYILSSFFNKENRNYPFTDEKISIILKKKGYNIARRTITKYRKQLLIPISKLRKCI